MNEHAAGEADESIASKLERMQIVFDDAPSALAVCDSNGRLREANKTFCALLSKKASEMRGTRLIDQIEPGDREEFARQWLAAMSDTPGIRCSVGFGHRGSTQRAVLSLRYSWSRGQSFLIVEAVASDSIADGDEARKSLSSILIQVAAEWTETFDAVEIPIFMIDGDLLVRRLNRAAARIAGGAFRNILQKRIDSLGTGEPWRSAVRLAQQLLETGKPQTLQAHDDEAGTYWNLSVSIANVKAPDDKRIIVTAHNVTDIRELQDAVRRAALLSALGSLVAGVAHEVRNPIFGISAALEAFAAEHRDLPSLEEYLVAIRRDLRRLKILMDDLLQYGKPPSLTLTRQPFPPIVQQAVDVCQSVAAQNGAAITVDVPDGLPEVNVDAEQMIVVFKNLIENAIGFSRRGGEVAVTASSVVTGEAHSIACSVADRGPGFARADLPRIFEPFYSRRAGGTGLGLALVQRIVTDHGGTVAAHNRRGGGALMTVTLPVAT